MAAEPVRKAVELKPVKATSKELSTYSIKAPAYAKWLSQHSNTASAPFWNAKYDAKVIPAAPWATWLNQGSPQTNKQKYKTKSAAQAAYDVYFGGVAQDAHKKFEASELERAKRTPSATDKKQLALSDLITKYPGAYKGTKARSDAAMARIDATGSTPLYKQFTSKAAPYALQGPVTSARNKDAIIELRNLLNSDEFKDLPEDVKQQMIEDNYGGDLADLTRGGISPQEIMDAMRNQTEGGDDAGAFGTGDVDPVAQDMYAKSYTPGSSSQDSRFGPETAKEIAAIKSERESMKEHDKEKAYRYMNPSAGEYAQTYDNPADQKVYQDQVAKLRTAMKKLGPIVQDNAGLN